MNRKFVISVVVMFVLGMGLSYFNHGVLLSVDYARLPNVMRPPTEAREKMPLMAFAYVCIGVAFTWLFLKARDWRPWLVQGVRFGLAIAVLTAVPMYLIYHVVAQFPLDLAIKQIAVDAITFVIMGIALAWIHRRHVTVPLKRGE